MSETHISTQYGYKRRRRDAIICYNDSSAKYMVTQRIAMIGDQIRNIWRKGRRPFLISVVFLILPFFFIDKSIALGVGLVMFMMAFLIHEAIYLSFIAMSPKREAKNFFQAATDLYALYSRRRSWRDRLKIIETAPDYRISSG